MPDKLRLFVALPLPATGIECLAGLQERIKSRGLAMGWVRPRNLHLTMKFLGDVPVSEVDGLAATLRRVVATHPSLKLILQGLGVFPGIRRPRVLWTGLGGEIDALRSMYDDLEDGLAGHGFQRDNRGFRAHITLGRIRKRIDVQHLLDVIGGLGQFEPLPFDARRLVLYKSDLKPSGAVYTPLAEAELA